MIRLTKTPRTVSSNHLKRVVRHDFYDKSNEEGNCRIGAQLVDDEVPGGYSATRCLCIPDLFAFWKEMANRKFLYCVAKV